MYLYYTMVVMSLTTLLDKKSPLFSELCLQSGRSKQCLLLLGLRHGKEQISEHFKKLLYGLKKQ